MLKHMDSIEEVSASMTKNAKNAGFVEHVFLFDDQTKSELMNVLQYAILAIIPIVLMNKLTQAYVPDSDEEKPTLEITIEILLQIAILFVGMYFIDRIITFIPTFSKVDYPSFNVMNVILGFLVIVLSLQTKLGLKVEILTNRLLDYFGLGETEYQPTAKQQRPSNVSVSQPIVHNGGGMPIMPQQSHQPSRSDSLGNYQMMPNATSAIDQLPNQQGNAASSYANQQQMPPAHPSQQQSMPDFDAMYQEPFAMGGGFGGSSFAPFN